MDCLHSATERFRVTQEQASSRRSFSWQFHMLTPSKSSVMAERPSRLNIETPARSVLPARAAICSSDNAYMIR
jgi:hypothetical protein